MADRFPSLEDFNEAGCLGQTEVVNNNAADTDDFLARERAALGDDADQFATPNDQAATVEDDDLLGGDDYVPQQGGSAEISGFESSFPAIDTQNEVRLFALIQPNPSQP
ncbi:hypothetical protein EIK77_003094 [Talaromyces pinophilus]|nr:hypothetical protein EIK77_003094 [Talaromyces pinophilus]